MQELPGASCQVLALSQKPIAGSWQFLTMTPNQWKRLFTRIVLWAGFALGSVLLVLLAFATWHIYVKEREASAEHMNEVRVLSDLSNRKTTLDEDLKKLDTSRGIEEEVRKRFPVAKPGEEEIMLVAATDPASATSTRKNAFWNDLFDWWPW